MNRMTAYKKMHPVLNNYCFLFSEIMLLLLLISVFRIRAVMSEDIIKSESREKINSHYIETVKEHVDGEHVVIRSRRSAMTDVCKYKKGEWSACHQMIMVS